MVGRVSLDEIVASLARRAEDGRWKYAALIDASAISTAPTSQELGRIRNTMLMLSGAHGRVGPQALLVSQAVAYGMGRMFEAHTDEDPFEFRVFTTRAAAEAWLDETR